MVPLGTIFRAIIPDRIKESMCNKIFYMTQMDLFEDSTQSVWNVSIKYDTWKNIENCTVLEESSVKRKTYT